MIKTDMPWNSCTRIALEYRIVTFGLSRIFYGIGWLRHLNQFFPNFDHCICVQFTVLKQIPSCAPLFVWGHILDLREDAHRFPTVMHPLQMMIIQGWIIRIQGRKNTFDREAAAHGAIVVVPFLERRQQIPDIL